MAKYYLSAFADEAADTLDEQIEALHKHRIPFIELRGIESGPIDAQSNGSILKIKEKLEAGNIRISALGSRLGKTKIASPFLHSLESLKRLCEICHVLSAERIRMFSYFIPEGEDPAAYRDEVMERLERLCDYADGEGVKLMHENESAIFGEKTEQVLDIHRSIPRLGCIFDPSNYRMAEVDQAATVKQVMPYVDYLHIKDCTNGKLIVPAGYGDGLIPEAIEEHNRIFEGDSFLVLEPHLTKFKGYGEIDKHELKNKFTFANNAESFDFAVKSLKEVLVKNGFEESEDMAWTK